MEEGLIDRGTIFGLAPPIDSVSRSNDRVESGMEVNVVFDKGGFFKSEVFQRSLRNERMALETYAQGALILKNHKLIVDVVASLHSHDS